MPSPSAATLSHPPAALPTLPLPTHVDLARSRALGFRVSARNRECYRNAVLALQSDIELANAGAVYVEGLVVAHRRLTIPFEHAWIELPSGTVIDPTPHYCRRDAPPRSYFGAFRWTRDEAFELCMVPNARYTFSLRLPDMGRYEPSWCSAAAAACRLSDALHGVHTAPSSS